MAPGEERTNEIPDPESFYSEIGSISGEPSRPICGVIYSDWFDQFEFELS
jgi:hypothetical protein